MARAHGNPIQQQPPTKRSDCSTEVVCSGLAGPAGGNGDLSPVAVSTAVVTARERSQPLLVGVADPQLPYRDPAQLRDDRIKLRTESVAHLSGRRVTGGDHFRACHDDGDPRLALHLDVIVSGHCSEGKVCRIEPGPGGYEDITRTGLFADRSDVPAGEKLIRVCMGSERKTPVSGYATAFLAEHACSTGGYQSSGCDDTGFTGGKSASGRRDGPGAFAVD
jgi:hypothetical protein